MPFIGRAKCYITVNCMLLYYIVFVELPSFVGSIEKPLAGSWSSWSRWSTCGRTCGGGTQSRVRMCDNPAPLNGGKHCVGKDTEERKCNENKCPICK